MAGAVDEVPAETRAWLMRLREVAFNDTFSEHVCRGAELVGALPGPGSPGYRFRLEPAPHTANRFASMHGGALTTVVDVLTSYALCMSERARPAHVSTHISIDFLSPMPLNGGALIADCRLLRVGRSLAVMECEIRTESEWRLVAKGSHTKAFVAMPSDVPAQL